MSDSQYRIEVRHLTKKYPPMRKGTVGIRDLIDGLKGRREEVIALSDLSFNIRSGEWFGILGPNGAGKTTFCDVLLDITTPTSGQILLDGTDVNRQFKRIRGRICTMQYWFVRERIRVRDSLRRAGMEWMLDPGEAQRRIDWLVDLFGIRDKLDDWYIRLSMGTRVKVMIIATLMSGADVLVFDEPTPWMDVITRRKLYDQLRDFQKEMGTTIIWTTHNLHEAQATCNRIAVINTRLLTVTTPSRLAEDMQKANLEEAFVELLTRTQDPAPPTPAGSKEGLSP